MQKQLTYVRNLADEVEKFPLGNCGPSDDSDEQTAYLYAFREIATRFVMAARRLDDDMLNKMMTDLDIAPEFIQDAYTLRAELLGVIDALRDLDEKELTKRRTALQAPFIEEKIIAELGGARFQNFDTAKFVKFCEELNDCYIRGNYLSCLLLIRAVMNHVPPLFGAQTFSEVVSQSGRSVKKILAPLEETARPLADFHNHMFIRRKEVLPARGQVEPYRTAFEMLISEVIAKGESK